VCFCVLGVGVCGGGGAVWCVWVWGGGVACVCVVCAVCV